MEEEIKEKNIKKLSEKDNAKLKYNEKLELVKQHYGVNFNVSYFKNNEIDKIKFYNIDYKNIARNISLIYEPKCGKINHIFYEYENDTALRNYDDKSLITRITNEYKLKLVVAEINRLNSEYKKELLEIDEKYKKKSVENIEQLEIKKKVKND